MPLRSDWSDDDCPIRRALDVLGDPWVLVIIRDILHGNGRFDGLRKSLKISEAVLSRRLQDMVDAGLLTRSDYRDGARVRQRYIATESAAELLPVLQQLAIWGEKHTVMPKHSAHMSLIHRSCGRETVHGEVCSECGEVLVAEEMTWIKPWKGRSDNLVGPGGSAAPS